ncbi:sterile alpha motif domain-containing protein 9-like [Misgurnus anguillicaudatus]|uniref:sterile alpha motif domain-containing protein 9-like n=1 Tax=Misgurnus anguillicaudatus TaxID=75329 RepID=UPI003CCF1475
METSKPQVEGAEDKTDVSSEHHSMKPHPFCRFDATHVYIENSIFDVTETGPIDLIQPCHEYKAFTNTPEEKRMKKFTDEVIRFAAACMNSRTNGTIHFGVKDEPHGQILGVSIQKTDKFDTALSHAIEAHFSPGHVQIAKICIKPPRFVEVLKADKTPAKKYVIEVDVEPSSVVCKDYLFYISDLNKDEKKKKYDKSFFIRDRGSSSTLTGKPLEKYEKNTKDISHPCQLRKEAEEKHLSAVKNSVHGSKLCDMITGGTGSMDKSNYERYIVVANKSHPTQLENLRFLLHMKLAAVLDFDPESAEHGLNTLFKERKTVSVYSPTQYKTASAIKDKANTSWVFCNGGINGEEPSDADKWSVEKGSSVRDVVSLLFQTAVGHPKKFLVIFLLLSEVNDATDPLLEIFSMFLEKLQKQNQILCISDSETKFTFWKNLLKNRYNIEISRSIFELSFAEVNDTVLSLFSENHKSSRFLPCFGGGRVVLTKTTEESLDKLSVLCVNQCEGECPDRRQIEERFYKGEKVSWWNFYFSEQPGATAFFKRDKFDYIVNTIIPDIQKQNRACVFFNILHEPDCGGTALAMHVLWKLKEKFRCTMLKDTVLKDTTDNLTTVAKQVADLLTYETKEKETRLPVLLMIDNILCHPNVLELQNQIEKECLNQNIFSKSPQVIIVNCMRVESCEQTEGTDDAVAIGNQLSEKEYKQIGDMLRTYANAETFLLPAFLRYNFSPDLTQSVVKNTLNGFNFQHKPAQLFAILVLLDVYCRDASMLVSTCEEFLGLHSESGKVEDGLKKFNVLLRRRTVASKPHLEVMKVIHPAVAEYSLKELSASHSVTRAEITNLLLTTDLFYDSALGRKHFMQYIQSMLVNRQNLANGEDFTLSPLIQHIKSETPGREGTVLLNAKKWFTTDTAILQFLDSNINLERS